MVDASFQGGYPIPAETGTPLWWTYKLSLALLYRRQHMLDSDNYYRGNHPLPFLTKSHNMKMRDEFAKLLADCRSNFMRLVVDAVQERLQVTGFRLSASSDAPADQESWDIWQANNMDENANTALVEALIKGVSYLSVWYGDDYPSIAVEDPCQTIIAYTPGSNFQKRDAALKMWADEWTGDVRANLYLPSGIHKFIQKGVAPQTPTFGTLAGITDQAYRPYWVPLGTPDEFVPNPLGVVPIIPLRNRPRLLLEGESEIVDAVPTQNRINATLFMRALAGYFGAHRQRWAVGLRMMEDENGNPVEPFDVAIDKLWQSEDMDVKFGEFSQTDLTGYISAIEQDVLHIAVTTRTPRHYLIEQGQSPSGDALESAEAGLIKKCERKQTVFGEGLEEAIRLARLFGGMEDAPVDSEIVWADPQMRNEAVITDAVVKQYQSGLVPWEAAMEKLGYTATQIARYRSMRMQDSLLQALAAPTQAAPQAAMQPAMQPGMPGVPNGPGNPNVPESEAENS